MKPEAKLSPPPTRSRISSRSRIFASWNLPSCQQIAPQSFMVALRTVRRVVATAWKFG
jgi:hypothetical protein